MIVTLRNDFHRTSVGVRVSGPGHVLTVGQVRRIRHVLCGMEDCKCGQGLSTRGRQTWPDGRPMLIEADLDGGARLDCG